MKLEELNSMQPGEIFFRLHQEKFKIEEIHFILDQYLLFYRDNPKEATQYLRDFIIEYSSNRPVLSESLGQYIENNVLKNRLSA